VTGADGYEESSGHEMLYAVLAERARIDHKHAYLCYLEEHRRKLLSHAQRYLPVDRTPSAFRCGVRVTALYLGRPS
jgi:hypothetical protein